MFASKFKKTPFVFALFFCAACSSDEFDLPGVETDFFGNPKLDRTDTLGGVDADNNGVRDDIDEIINARWSHEVQRQAARQIARALRLAILVNKANDAEVRRISFLISRSVRCAYYVNDSLGYETKPSSTIKKMEALSTNTKKRLLEYNKYNAALHGKVFSLPKGDTCDYH